LGRRIQTIYRTIYCTTPCTTSPEAEAASSKTNAFAETVTKRQTVAIPKATAIEEPRISILKKRKAIERKQQHR